VHNSAVPSQAQDITSLILLKMASSAAIPEEFNEPANLTLWNSCIPNICNLFQNIGAKSAAVMFEPRESWDKAIVAVKQNSNGVWVPVYDRKKLRKVAIAQFKSDTEIVEQYRQEWEEEKNSSSGLTFAQFVDDHAWMDAEEYLQYNFLGTLSSGSSTDGNYPHITGAKSGQKRKAKKTNGARHQKKISDFFSPETRKTTSEEKRNGTKAETEDYSSDDFTDPDKGNESDM
jgi:hypothetical protein